MKQLRSLLLAVAMMAGISPVAAQTFPTVPASTVIGRLGVTSGPAQAIPFLIFSKAALASATINGVPIGGGLTIAAGTSMTVSTVGSIITINGQVLAAGNGISLSTVGSTVTISAPTATQTAGWKVANLRADNTTATPSVSMDLTADYAVFYNPSTGGSNVIVGAALTKTCAINSFGAGGRDQAGAFSSGNVVWFYYIWGSSPGVSCVSSLTAPSGGGPTLPSTYTAFAPAFPLPLVGSATLQPTLPQGGSTIFRVRGNSVFLPNTPFITCAGFPGGSCDFSAWVPSVNTGVSIYVDLELTCTASCIAGVVLSTASGNFYNASLYPIGSQPTVNNAYLYPVVLDASRIFTLTWSHSSGTPSLSVAFAGPAAYTFSDGN